MLVRIDESSGEPLYEQIASQLRRSIGKGDPRPGARLPTARELAESLEVNMHTVLRAYTRLRDEGLVEMRRGRGVVVLRAGAERATLVGHARAFTAEARRLGLSERDVVALVKEHL